MTPEWAEQQELCQHGERRKFCASCAKVLPLPVADSVEWPEHMIEAECTRLLEQDGWRALRTDPVSDRGRGKGFGEVGMADHMYIRYNCAGDVAAGFDPWPPDFYALSETLWIEFKSAKGKPAKHQTEWHTKERARGALTWIAGVDFPASVSGFVEKYRNSGLNRGRV
jgi:hypothetical protein